MYVLVWFLALVLGNKFPAVYAAAPRLIVPVLGKTEVEQSLHHQATKEVVRTIIRMEEEISQIILKEEEKTIKLISTTKLIKLI